MEVLKTNTDLLSGKRIANYHFGSQTEATTIHYFHSDVDTLFSFTDFDVKQSVEEWRTASGDQSYRKYKLMINTDQSPPGYARLQVYTNKIIMLKYFPVVSLQLNSGQINNVKCTKLKRKMRPHKLAKVAPQLNLKVN